MRVQEEEQEGQEGQEALQQSYFKLDFHLDTIRFKWNLHLTRPSRSSLTPAHELRMAQQTVQGKNSRKWAKGATPSRIKVLARDA